MANAAYFKGTWLYQFKKSQTNKGLFYMSIEDYTFVDMMRQKGNFRHGETYTVHTSTVLNRETYNLR